MLMLEFADSGIVGFATGLAADTRCRLCLGPRGAGQLGRSKGSEQFQFTVNSLLSSSGGPVDISDVPPPDDFQFENFNFSSSFSGSMTVIPEPATISLAALALLGLLVYRRRA